MLNEIAVSIVERYLGFSVVPKEQEETLKLGKYGFELTYKPFISLVSVEARTSQWGMPGMDLGQSVWMEIPVNQAHTFTHDSVTHINVPLTLFGTPYTELRVRYKTGLISLPNALEQAINEIINLIHKGEIDEWNSQLPSDVMEVLDDFKKKPK